MNATRFDRVNQLVLAIFGPRFYVSDYHNKTRYHIKYPTYDQTYDPMDEKSCLIFYFENDLSDLYIVSLAKCGPPHDLRSGTMLLNMIDALAGLIPECKTITLQDESTVRRCSYVLDLAFLTIWLTGISWYNQLGYKQQSYEFDTKHNHKIRNMLIRDAVPILLASPKLMKRYPKFMEYKSEIDVIFGRKCNEVLACDLSDLKVYEYVAFMYNRIKQSPEYECFDPVKHNAKLVAYVINAFGHLLEYCRQSRTMLVKDVVHGKYIPPFINPSTMHMFSFEPEDTFNCGECGRVLRGDDLPPWNIEPKGVKYYTTRDEGEHAELICHACATREAPKSPPKTSAPGGGARKSRTRRRKPLRKTRHKNAIK
jgi:hypothetical protein